MIRALLLALVLAAPASAQSGGSVLDDESLRADVIELVQLAGLPKAYGERFQAFADGIAKTVPEDTPAEAVAVVVDRLRDEARPSVVLSKVAADAAMRFSLDELRATAADLRGGGEGGDVVTHMREKLGHELTVELARASRVVLGDVNDEVAASTRATDAALEHWRSDLEALERRVEAAQPEAPAPADPAAPATETP